MAIDTVEAPAIEQTDRWTGRSIDFSVAALYLSLALWVIGPLWADPAHLDPAANASDSPFFEWVLRHAVRIFTVGEHPFHTPTLDAPYGVNLLANTGLLSWQALIIEELLSLTVLAGLVFVLGYAVWRPAEVKERIRPFLTGLVVAVLTAGLLLAYPLWYQFAGPQSYHGLPEFVLGYSADLASYLAFPKLSLAHGAGTLSPQPEENTFFGWPLVLLLVAAVIWLGRRAVVRGLALVAAVFMVLSLGATADWRGQPVWTGAPWHLLNHLPLVGSVLAIRVGLGV